MTLTLNNPEAALLEPVAASFKFRGFEVYREVRFEGQRIDLVAERGESILFAIHGKVALNAEVVEQARKSQGVSDATVIAVQHPQRVTVEHAARMKELDVHGIGLLYVSGRQVIEKIEPAPNHHAQPDRLRAVLRDGQQTIGTAGSKSDQWTPEREWLEAIKTELDLYGALRLVDCHACQPRGPERVGKNAVPRAIHRLYEAGKMPWATIVTNGGQSALVKL